MSCSATCKKVDVNITINSTIIQQGVAGVYNCCTREEATLQLFHVCVLALEQL